MTYPGFRDNSKMNFRNAVCGRGLKPYVNMTALSKKGAGFLHQLRDRQLRKNSAPLS